MAKKISYRATISTGEVFTRSSLRAYSHFWINKTTAAIRRADGERKFAGTHGFCSTKDLAERSARASQKPGDEIEVVAAEIVSSPPSGKPLSEVLGPF